MAATTAERDLFRMTTRTLRHYLKFSTQLTSTAESSDNDKTYVLPDGNITTVSDERLWRSRCAKGTCPADSECLQHPKSEASALIYLTTKSTKKLVVEPPVTVEVSLCSAAVLSNLLL